MNTASAAALSQRCPKCRSAKYSALPFGNVLIGGSAQKYRCLTCESFFAAGAEPVARPAMRRPAADMPEQSIPAIEIDFVNGGLEEKRRAGMRL